LINATGKMDLVHLGELVVAEYGASLKACDRDPKGRWTVFGSSGPVGKHSRRLVDHATLVIGRKGSAGAITFAPEGGWPIDTAFFTVIRDPSRVDLRYLYYSLKQAGLQQKAISTAVPGLNRETLYHSVIPLPFSNDPKRSLAEQKRIAGILDAADDIRRQRRSATELASQLVLSLFRESFNRWLEMPPSEMPQLGSPELSQIASGVTKGRRFNGQPTVIVPYIRVANVQDGFLDLSEIKKIEALPSDVETLRLLNGDVLMTEGGDFDKLGRGAIWEAEVCDCIHQNHVFRVRCNRQHLLPIYLANYIRTDVAKSYFLRCAKKTSNLASMNMTQLKATPVACPPVELQESFATDVERINRMQARQNAATRDADAMFSSLVVRAFAGEL